ncbi:Ankyrin repeat and SAM domain-containing protein 6 [Paraconiothyrium brasiliense]|uniref:Ankyrin repeat and SAM domain-containing protein 6 n=1 Tax=Paraconiothyrium brasiliense TaxID=300254 RepID=A0ABR3RTY2_9PLEO
MTSREEMDKTSVESSMERQSQREDEEEDEVIANATPDVKDMLLAFRHRNPRLIPTPPSDADAEPLDRPSTISPSCPPSDLPPTRDLFEAAKHNDIPTLSRLLDAGLPIEIETNDGYTALTIAIIEGNVEATRLLLDNGADANHRTQRLPPLVHAAMSPTRGPTLMQLLLSHGAVLTSVSGPDGKTAMHWAASEGVVASVDFLVRQMGVDVEARCGGGRTALMLAAQGGHEDVVKALWAHGADGGAKTALALASHFGHPEIVDVLIAAGADIEARSDDPKDCTPLMLAACANEVGVVKKLMESGADLHAIAFDGNSVLDVALLHRCPGAVDVLLEAIGGEEYPRESVAVQFAMAREHATIKALMATASVMYSHMEVQVGEPNKHAWIGWVLNQGGTLVQRLALAKMLHAALEEHDIDLVKAVVLQGCDVNRRLESGKTPLGFAVIEGDVGIVQVLLEAGANPIQAMGKSDKRNGRAMTPFDYAVVNMRDETDYQVANLLLGSGRCRVNQGVDVNTTAFSFALEKSKGPGAWEGALDLAERMALSIKNVDGDRDDQGFTLLHVATHHQNLRMIDLLLNRGADIEAKANDGMTPFLLACSNDPNFALQLLQRGANLKAKTHKTNASALHGMAAKGLPFCPPLIEMGLDINEQTLKGYTPLASALSRGHEALALTLMEKGAHVNWKTDRNHTALHFAARNGMERVLAKILERGIDVNATNTRGWLSLHEACASGNTAVVAQLLDAGADIERPLPNGDRPLHCALINEKEDIALLLLERGADFTALASKKRTPLHLAAYHDLPRAADALLSLSECAMIEAVDDETWTPLCCASSAAIVDMLIRAGADIHYADKDGWTPLHQAVLAGTAGVAIKLLDAGASLDARTTDDGLTVRERANDMWSWGEGCRSVRPQLLQIAADRREERQRKEAAGTKVVEESEALGEPFEMISGKDCEPVSP